MALYAVGGADGFVELRMTDAPPKRIVSGLKLRNIRAPVRQTFYEGGKVVGRVTNGVLGRVVFVHVLPGGCIRIPDKAVTKLLKKVKDAEV
jgi:hypothetical protein